MLVLGLICVTATLLGAVFTISTGEDRFMKRTTVRTQAMAYADGILETMYDQWRVDFSNIKDGSTSTTLWRTNGMTHNQITNGLSTNSPAIPALAIPSATQLPVPANCSLVTSTSASPTTGIWPATPFLAPVSTGDTQPTAETGSNSRLRVHLYYIATVVVNYPGGTAIVKRTFTRAGQNIFDNFLFSTQPTTEIDPGQPMYINGTVYVGGNLYTPSSNLNFQQNVTYTGTYSTGFAPLDTRGATASNPSYPANDPPQQGASQSLLGVPTSSLDPNFMDNIISNDHDSDGNMNNNGYHELVEMQTLPLSTNPDPLQTTAGNTAGSSERLANNADFRISIDASNNVTIYKGSVAANAASDTTALTSADPAYSTLMGAITTDTTLVDGRVNDNVRVVNVDVSKIAAAVNASSTTYDVVGTGGPTAAGGGTGTPDGILLYIQDTSAGTAVTTNGLSAYTTTTTSAGNLTTVAPKTGAAPLTSSGARGIRLVNGGTVPNVGLTIATPNPVYVQGDYNTGTTTNYGTVTTSTAGALTVSNQPPSNGSSAYPNSTSAPTEIASGYPSSSVSTKPIAVIAGDAVTILSNSWSDGNSSAVLTSRNPTNTTVNAALMAGNVPTTTSAYSGGIENFPRLLENWNNASTGANLTIHGSFALMYDSEQAVQPWQNTGNYYNAPNRRWFFDPVLMAGNPPGFPAAYTFSRGRWIPHS